jgi:hypothetical protein
MPGNKDNWPAETSDREDVWQDVDARHIGTRPHDTANSQREGVASWRNGRVRDVSTPHVRINSGTANHARAAVHCTQRAGMVGSGGR